MRYVGSAPKEVKGFEWCIFEILVKECLRKISKVLQIVAETYCNFQQTIPSSGGLPQVSARFMG